MKRKLKAQGVEFSPIPPARIFDLLEKKGRVDAFVGLVATFLGRYKTEGYAIDKVLGRRFEIADQPRTTAFLKVFEMIFRKYEGSVAKCGESDLSQSLRPIYHSSLFEPPYDAACCGFPILKPSSSGGTM